MLAAVELAPCRKATVAPRAHLGTHARLTQVKCGIWALIAAAVLARQAHEPIASVLTYAVWGLLLLTGGLAAFLQSRFSGERVRLRWALLGVYLCGGGLTYLIASLNNLLPVMHTLDPVMRMAGSVATAALLLALTVSFRGSPSSIVVIDLLQTALYIALTYFIHSGDNPWARDVQSHVLISLLLTLSSFLIALIAPLSATSTQERRFFRIVAVYLGLAWLARFWGSQVGLLWEREEGNLYVLPAIGLCAALALYLVDFAWHTAQRPPRDRELRQRRLMLRNLMPSFLAISSLLIALYVFRHAALIGSLVVFAAVVLYLSRTLLLQTHMAQEALDLRQTNERLEELSQRDALTGAGNRRSMAVCYERGRHLPVASDDATAEDEGDVSIALLLIDLDFFKQANDLLGHLHGDRVLTSVTGVLAASCRAVAGSHVARFGGDEFALLLPALEGPAAMAVAEAIRAGVEALALCAGERTISVSIGVATTDGAESLEDLIRRADRALYRAKLAGRNRAAFELQEPPTLAPAAGAEWLTAR